MPNYCTNIVKAPKEVLEDLFDNGKVTFEKLIPMPKTLNITEGTITEEAIVFSMSKKSTDEFFQFKKLLENTKDDYYSNLWNKYKNAFSIEKLKDIEKKAITYVPDESERKLGIKTLEEFGNLCLNNVLKYGYVSWYDWSCANWGTKWDALESEGTPEKGKITFLTAWSEPMNVIEKLFKQHPKQKIEWQYEGEGQEFKGKIYSDGKGKIFKEDMEITNEEEEEQE